jgi:hypothetical protein
MEVVPRKEMEEAKARPRSPIWELDSGLFIVVNGELVGMDAPGRVELW